MKATFQRHPFSAVCKVAPLLLFGVLASSAQTNRYLVTGSETNITLNPGLYQITAYGAHGGVGGYQGTGYGGLGAEMSAVFSFSVLTTLTLLVGGAGAVDPISYGGGGGGGGSFVINGSTPLLIAGGGGGGAAYYGPVANGTNGLISGGSGGGGNSGGTYGGGGGGGYSGNGANGGGAYGGGGGGYSFLNGGQGGYSRGHGGYGGGGGGDGDPDGGGGGGGGGYTGGDGGYGADLSVGHGGGGGSSYIDSSAVAVLSETSGIASPDGSPNGEIIISAVTVTLNYQVINGNLVLNWGQGTLLSADTADGTYTPVTGASSPYTNSMTGAQQYFRLLVH